VVTLKRSIICLDTNILIWGIKKVAPPGQEDMIYRAQDLIQKLDKSSSQVIVPSLVLAELLMPVKEEDHGKFFADISKQFIIVPFDTQAALHYATLWKSWREKNSEQQLGDNRPTRAKMKTDFMIVATAVSRKAECIYSADSDIEKFAKGHIAVRKLPVSFYQGDILKAP
jgi:predicted nucleic acid-binding protein